MKFESFGQFRPNSKILVSFHGLPGIKSDANRDLLEALGREKHIFSLLIPYPNLSNNSFSFLEDTRQVLEVLRHLSEKYKSHEWQILGHSWGGLVALIALSQKIVSAQKVCLLSPYTKFPQSDGVLVEILNKLQEEYPLLFNTKRGTGSLVKEVREVEKVYSPQKLAQQIHPSSKLYLIQALDDHEVLPQDSKKFLESCSCEVSYKEFSTDHSFLFNRSEILKELKGFFDA